MIHQISTLRAQYEEILVIVSPPRCSSTALARVFWEHPAVRYYAHEPFETSYYRSDGFERALANLAAPLDLETNQIKRRRREDNLKSLLIKEMPYQAGEHIEFLLRLATRPVIFLMRDPRLNIASRMRKKRQVGDSPLFPKIETGWELLKMHVRCCEVLSIPFVLVDSADFRNRQQVFLRRLFGRLGLAFEGEQVRWDPHPEVDLDNLGGKHTHLYGKVLGSSALRPEHEPIPPMEHFPREMGFRDHVRDCLLRIGMPLSSTR